MRCMWLVVAAIAGGCGGDGQPDPYAIYKCETTVTSGMPDGHHNPGMDCQGSCHDHGFTIAGTVFTDGTGAMPAVGATVTVRDANLQEIKMVTASNGNFYTMAQFQYPFRVWVSSCPALEIMPDSVDTNTNLGASCNQGVCHNNGAGTGVIALVQ